MQHPTTGGIPMPVPINRPRPGRGAPLTAERELYLRLVTQGMSKCRGLPKSWDPPHHRRALARRSDNGGQRRTDPPLRTDYHPSELDFRPVLVGGRASTDWRSTTSRPLDPPRGCGPGSKPVDELSLVDVTATRHGLPRGWSAQSGGSRAHEPALRPSVPTTDCPRVPLIPESEPPQSESSRRR